MNVKGAVEISDFVVADCKCFVFLFFSLTRMLILDMSFKGFVGFVVGSHTILRKCLKMNVTHPSLRKMLQEQKSL